PQMGRQRPIWTKLAANTSSTTHLDDGQAGIALKDLWGHASRDSMAVHYSRRDCPESVSDVEIVEGLSARAASGLLFEGGRKSPPSPGRPAGCPRGLGAGRRQPDTMVSDCLCKTPAKPFGARRESSSGDRVDAMGDLLGNLFRMNGGFCKILIE